MSAIADVMTRHICSTTTRAVRMVRTTSTIATRTLYTTSRVKAILPNTSATHPPPRTRPFTTTKVNSMPLRYISQEEAQKIDQELMSEQGAFSLDQLMELAGLACAQSLAECYPKDKYERVMVICGPGNQGGDGLVAARHLHMFGYKPMIYMPKPGNKDIYKRLTTQCTNLDIPLLSSVEEFDRKMKGEVDVILDAIFGFSFSPPVRPPFDTLLNTISHSSLPVVSVDIPSGWSVSSGPPSDLPSEGGENVAVLWSDVLVSLTAPKEGVRKFAQAKEGKTKGRHFLGGRFVPKSLEDKYKLDIPEYPGYQQIVEITDLQ